MALDKQFMTIVLGAYNEAARVGELIRAYRDFAEIIVLDNYSEDGTEQIATSLGAKVIQREIKGQPTKRDFIRVAEAASHSWIHYGICSEVLPRPLIERLREICTSSDQRVKAIQVARISYTLGVRSHVADPGPVRRSKIPHLNFRFIRKEFIDWDRSRIHREIPGTFTTDEIVRIPQDGGAHILHFRNGDCAQTELKHAEYADIEANSKWEAGERFSWLKLFLGPLRQFLVLLASNPTKPGVIFAMQHAQLIIGLYIRLWAFETTGRDGTPRASNDTIRRDKLLELSPTGEAPRDA